MCKARDLVLFLAGAEFFHTITHLFTPYLVQLPFKTNVFLLTVQINTWAIVINGAITIALIVWACKMDSTKKKSKH
jgi:hypothetical protein